MNEQSRQKQHNRTRRARSSSVHHIVINIFEDRQVQVVSHNINPTLGTDGLQESTAFIVSAPPLHPTLFDGTYNYDGGNVDLEWTTSSESVLSADSDSEMALEEVLSNAVSSVPVIEPSGEKMVTRKKSISVVGNVRGQAVGAMIDPGSTVLMQMSRGNIGCYTDVRNCMAEINEVLNNDDSIVILRYPSVEDSQRSRRVQVSHQETAKKMMELTEDVLRRVQGSSRESILMKLQDTLGEMLNQPEDTIAVHSFSREVMGGSKSEALVGFFKRDNEAALFVQAVDSSNKITRSLSGCEDENSMEDQIGLERLKSFLQESLQNQEQALSQTFDIEPDITISRSGNKVVGVLSFPNSASAVVKTTVDRFPLDKQRSEIVQSMKDLLQNLAQQSTGKLLVQMHSGNDRETVLDQIKNELDESVQPGAEEGGPSVISVRESDDKVIGVLNYSGGSIVIQTSSKNWIHAHSCSDPKDLLQSIRLMIELFIMSSELTDVDLRSLASIIVQVFHFPTVDLSEDFLSKHILQKMAFITHQLMNPSEHEDPLLIINQLRNTLELIARPEFASENIQDTYSVEVLKSYLDELLCEEDTQYENDLIIHTLRGALLDVLIHYDVTLSAALEDLLNLLKTISVEKVDLHSQSTVISSPGMTAITNEPLLTDRSTSEHHSFEVVQRIHNLLGDEEPSHGREVSYLSIFQSIFLTLLRIISGWSVRLKSFLDKDNRQQSVPVEQQSGSKLEQQSEPGTSVQRKPSVSFHLLKQPNDADERTPSDISQQYEDERHKLNSTIDDLRAFLEHSLNVPEAWEKQRKGSRMEFPEGSVAVKQRMLHLFSKLLDEAAKLKVTDKSSHAIHLCLDSASGELEQKEGAQFVVLSGKVRDRQHNLGLFFEARMVDLEDASKVESEVECVTEVRRLSDKSECLVKDELVPEVVESCLAEVGSDGAEEVDQREGSVEEFRMQETLSRYFELIQSYIQESMDPMREALGTILERIALVGTEKIREIRSSIVQTSSNFGEDYIVEMESSLEEQEVVLPKEMAQQDQSVQCAPSTASGNVQDNEILFDRLDNISTDLQELKQQMIELCGFLQNPPAQPSPTEPQSTDTGPPPSTQPICIESSIPDDSFVSVTPTAPTLDDIEGRISMMVEIVSLDDERRLSQVSDESDVRDHYLSAVECVPVPSEPPMVEDAQKCTLAEPDNSRFSEIFPVEQLTRRSTATQTMESRGTQTDVEEVADFVEESAICDKEATRLSTAIADQRPSVLSQLHKRISSFVGICVKEPIVQEDQARRSTRVSIVEPATIVDLEKGYSKESVEDISQDRQDLILEGKEEQRPSLGAEVDSESMGDVQKTVSPQDQQKSSSLVVNAESSPIPLHTEDQASTNSIDSAKEKDQQSRQTVESFDDYVNPQSEAHDDIRQDSKQSIESVAYEPILTTDPTNQRITEKQLDNLVDKPKDSVLLQQLSEIPVRDRPIPGLCDIAMSYQCKQVDAAIGRQFMSPAEIYSCHAIGPNQMMVHWKVAPQFADQIGGFEIYVDGEASSFYYSHRRRTGLLEDIDTRKQHRIVIYCSPESWIREAAQWAPGVFFYHL
ncbi:uncharacterized protein LOC134220631 [Armigeres subalbatus]|uniref:uncharacterized protein LOC134220631 n=1 Tax=Armigeres subalbatus TaxID=124917 RepID=UPI002ED281B4